MEHTIRFNQREIQILQWHIVLKTGANDQVEKSSVFFQDFFGIFGEDRFGRTELAMSEALELEWVRA